MDRFQRTARTDRRFHASGDDLHAANFRINVKPAPGAVEPGSEGADWGVYDVDSVLVDDRAVLPFPFVPFIPLVVTRCALEEAAASPVI
jgi:hypothetical protein